MSEADEHQPGDRSVPRVVHLHIPKTAGSALVAAFAGAYGNRLKIYPERFESRYSEADYHGYDFYTGHIGSKVASEIGGDFITVLRDPIDRFLSTYYYLRQLFDSGEEVTHKTSLTARYDIDQFAMIRDEPILCQELLNRMTWQIVYSHRMELREELIKKGVSESDLVRIAMSTLKKFAIVGVQEDMPGLARAIHERYNVVLEIDRVNITRSRARLSDISTRTRNGIEWWINLDQELYRTWIGEKTPRADSPNAGTFG